MSAAALQAISQCHAILGMDSDQNRFQWMQKNGEANFVCARRRREWLQKAGCSLFLANRLWDELSPVTRAKLGEVAA